MGKKDKQATEAADSSDDVAGAVQALTRVAQSLATSAQQMMQTVQTMQQMMRDMTQRPAENAAPAGPVVSINTWENDPFAEDRPTQNPPLATPVAVSLPHNDHEPPLQFAIADPPPPGAPAAGLFPPGDAKFRYWVAMEAVTRGINFWGPLLPAGTVWTTTQTPMRVTLFAGRDFNANYSRQFGLRFYQGTVHGAQFFSGESPDVSCHELGHAILDAVRPELFDAAVTEVACFHESFGDMSAILSALQMPSLRTKVLTETGGQLNVNSRLSRLAAQLGWAIRQLSPTAVDADCLRNAANRFFYQDPDSLSPSAPSIQLSSEVHSFSRVFTGAFLDALARMLTAAGANDASLVAVSERLGQLLIDGVLTAPITTGYYSQVAAAMIQADKTRNNGANGPALSSAFIQHGILDPSAAVALQGAPVPQRTAPPPGVRSTTAVGGSTGQLRPPFGADNQGYRATAVDAPGLPTREVATRDGRSIVVHAPVAQPRFNVASAALGVLPNHAAEPDQDVQNFVEDLIQQGKIDIGPSPGAIAAQLAAPDEHSEHSARALSKKTHSLIATSDGKVVLKRLHFNCGCSRGCP